jgi:predicted acylesterase/phospholipase RssA/CRP-like cAMP-binding protein
VHDPTDDRIQATVEKYFDIRAGEGGPLLDTLETRHLSGGEWLMQEGDAGDALYLLVQGRLLAWTGDADNGAEQKFLGEIVPGDSVGEVSLLTGEPRSASIQAIRDSLLVKISRAMFEKLVHQHPALVLKLASNVASVLHKSTAGTQAVVRKLSTITILPLDHSPRVSEFCQQLEKELQTFGTVLNLEPEALGQQGAPVDSLAGDEQVPDALRQWLNDQEYENRFVLYRCESPDTHWARFAWRQSDMVLLVADAALDPSPRPWEHQLDEVCANAAAGRILVLLQPPADKTISNTSAWLDGRKVDFHLHIRQDKPDDITRVARILSGNARGLVLGGGAVRGFAHLGVYRALREAGISIDWIGGTSIGGIMGSIMALDESFERACNLARESFVQGKPFSDYTIPLMSLVHGRRMERLLDEHAGYQIEDLPIPFFCVSCKLDTGELNLHERGFLPDALRATAAMTGIIPPAVLDRRLTVDGAVINNLPIDIMQQKLVGSIIAVDLSSSAEYHVNYDSLPSPWAVLRGRFLPFARKYRVPSLATIMLKATELGTLAHVREVGKQADLLLQPPVRQFGLTEIKAFDKIVAAGYEYAREELAGYLKRLRGSGSGT